MLMLASSIHPSIHLYTKEKRGGRKVTYSEVTQTSNPSITISFPSPFSLSRDDPFVAAAALAASPLIAFSVGTETRSCSKITSLHCLLW